MVDLYRVRDEAEAKKKMKRRLKRAREKAKQRAEKGAQEPANAWVLSTPNPAAAEGQEEGKEKEVEEEGDRPESVVASDELEFIVTLKATHKIRGLAFSKDASGGLTRVLLALGNNALEMYTCSLTSKECNRILSLDGPGHR